MSDTFTSFCGDILLPLAQTPATTGQTAPDTSKYFMLMLGVLALLFYFIVLKPKKDEDRKKQAAMDTVAKGDQVVTSGGIHGTVEAIDITKNIISVTIAPKTTIRVEKWALQTIVKTKSGAKEEKEAAAEK